MKDLGQLVTSCHSAVNRQVQKILVVGSSFCMTDFRMSYLRMNMTGMSKIWPVAELWKNLPFYIWHLLSNLCKGHKI